MDGLVGPLAGWGEEEEENPAHHPPSACIGAARTYTGTCTRRARRAQPVNLTTRPRRGLVKEARLAGWLVVSSAIYFPGTTRPLAAPC